MEENVVKFYVIIFLFIVLMLAMFVIFRDELKSGIQSLTDILKNFTDVGSFNPHPEVEMPV
jgi:hypothetical protein